MARITEKENLMMVIRGEIPEFVPRLSIAQQQVRPAFMQAKRTPDGGGQDIYGVSYVATRDTGGMALPVPNEFILDDVTKWRDVLHLPDLDEIDWETMAKHDLEKIDRNEYALAMGAGGYFLPLMNMMGFTEGLCAMYEEPEAVIEMYEYMSEFDCKLARKIIQYYQPDIFTQGDDIATANDPFVSMDMYRELVKPYHMRTAAIAKEYGLPINMHYCGHCDVMVDDWVGYGVNMWNPAQVTNDLLGIKAKYGRSFVLAGCWDSQGPIAWPEATEEQVKQAVRDCIDTYAPGGGFVFWASAYGAEDDIPMQNKIRWIQEEYDAYGRTFYQKHA